MLTIPTRLSITASQTAQTSTFASLLNSSNLTSTLDTVPSSTFFLPNNAAWISQGNTTASSTTINNHAVQGVVSYLPSFQDGQVLTTASGMTLTVSVKGGQVYINDALIVAPNLILE